MNGRVLSKLIFIGCLSGCATHPKLKVSFVDQGNPRISKETDSYAFPYTVVSIAAPDAKGAISVGAANHTYEPFRVAIARNDEWGVKTTVSLTKVINSDMLSEAGVQTQDNRAAAIEQIGKVVAAIIPVVGLSARDETCAAAPTGDPAPTSLPYSLDSIYALKACGFDRTGSGDPTQRSSWRQVGGVLVWFGPVPPDALPVQSGTPPQFASLSAAEYEHGIIYAACREMRLIIQPQKAAGAASNPPVTPQSVYVADPRYFRYVALPYKGKVALHDQCGTSTTTDTTSQPDSNLAIASAVVAQAKAIKDAIDANDTK